MRISEELNDAKIDALSIQIEHLIQRKIANDPELGHA
jgi:hypothetical protein